MLMDLAATYADGFSTVAPGALPTPERAAAFIQDMRRRVSEKDRDPDQFQIGGQMLVLAHEDENILTRALDNPVLRWLAATAGRLNQADWDAEGIEPVFPRDWHYAMKMQPMTYTQAEVDDVIERTTTEMVRRSFFTGSPAEIAQQIQTFVGTGFDAVSICDLLPMILEPEDAATAMSRSIEICRLLKEPVPAAR
jgi:phthiodiolone/phenolphthiodiolone dimycocerosates ketoreductase